MDDKELKFIKGLAEQLEVDKSEVNTDFPLAGDVWDSVVVLSTVALIDEYYGITVSGEDLENCETVGQVLALIRANTTE